ncbi:MAG TPA: SOS response-associated peptidase [Rhizomicrobium sp.]|jgi:putative SOS response-associated peptidase YedK|nr:SOS response-associated peptidase [Rhizomicrobium sp.]
MCRDYERERAWREHQKLLEQEYQRRQRQQLKIVSPAAEPNTYQASDTAPTDPAPIIRAAESGYGCELATARWWFVPDTYRGTLDDFRKKEKLSTFNARSDRIAKSPTFRKAFVSGRCLVPASGWYEWTEPPGWKKGTPKTKWRFTIGDHEPIFLAGICSHIQNGGDPTFTFALVTHAAGAGVDAYHDRAPFVLPPETWADWLDPGYDAPLDLIPEASAPDAYRVEYVSGTGPAD